MRSIFQLIFFWSRICLGPIGGTATKFWRSSPFHVLLSHQFPRFFSLFALFKLIDSATNSNLFSGFVAESFQLKVLHFTTTSPPLCDLFFEFQIPLYILFSIGSFLFALFFRVFIFIDSVNILFFQFLSQFSHEF